MKKVIFLMFVLVSVFMFAGCTASDEEEEEISLPDSDGGEVISDGDSSEVNDSGNGTGSDTDTVVPDADSDSGNNQEQPDTDTTPVSTNCNPGMKVCDASDPNSIFLCKEDGSGVEIPAVEKCDEGYSCLNGNCYPGACMSGDGYEGCEFYTAKLNNSATGKDTFSVAFANANPEKTATIQFFKVTGEGTEEPIPSFEYCEQVEKSSIFGSYNDMDCKNHDSSFIITVPPQSTVMVTPTKEQRMLDGTAASYLSFHIVSDFPVIAYQFNPYYNNSYSNDASLLFPTTRLGTEYYVATYESQKGYDGNGAAYFTVIGVSNTNVELE